MFLNLSVGHFVHRGGMSASGSGGLPLGRGVYTSPGHTHTPGHTPSPHGQQEGGTHPTGMLSSFPLI